MKMSKYELSNCVESYVDYADNQLPDYCPDENVTVMHLMMAKNRYLEWYSIGSIWDYRVSDAMYAWIKQLKIYRDKKDQLDEIHKEIKRLREER